MIEIVMTKEEVEKILLEVGFVFLRKQDSKYDIYFNEKENLLAYLGNAFIEVENQAIAFVYRSDKDANKEELIRFLTTGDEIGFAFKD